MVDFSQLWQLLNLWHKLNLTHDSRVLKLSLLRSFPLSSVVRYFFSRQETIKMFRQSVDFFIIPGGINSTHFEFVSP